MAPDWRDSIELVSRYPLRDSSSATFRAPRASKLTQGLNPWLSPIAPSSFVPANAGTTKDKSGQRQKRPCASS